MLMADNVHPHLWISMHRAHTCMATYAWTETGSTINGLIENSESRTQYLGWLRIASIIASNGPWKYSSIEAERERPRGYVSGEAMERGSGHRFCLLQKKGKKILCIRRTTNSTHSAQSAHTHGAWALDVYMRYMQHISEPHWWNPVMAYW